MWSYPTYVSIYTISVLTTPRRDMCSTVCSAITVPHERIENMPRQIVGTIVLITGFDKPCVCVSMYHHVMVH
jgi:hypothetical protein